MAAAARPPGAVRALRPAWRGAGSRTAHDHLTAFAEGTGDAWGGGGGGGEGKGWVDLENSVIIATHSGMQQCDGVVIIPFDTIFVACVVGRHCMTR